MSEVNTNRRTSSLRHQPGVESHAVDCVFAEDLLTRRSTANSLILTDVLSSCYRRRTLQSAGSEERESFVEERKELAVRSLFLNTGDDAFGIVSRTANETVFEHCFPRNIAMGVNYSDDSMEFNLVGFQFL